jgi:hypothetical protein
MTAEDVLLDCEHGLYAPPYITADGRVMWPGDGGKGGIKPWKMDVCAYTRTGQPDTDSTAAK